VTTTRPTRAEWADPAIRAHLLDAAQQERDALRDWNLRTILNHGTYAGFIRCRRRPEGACEACRIASHDYAKARRATPAADKERRYQKARSQAVMQLTRRFPAEFLTIMDAELQKVGAA
jgi:hypothetical protein